MGSALTTRRPFALLLTLYALLVTAFHSLLPYKTPWLLLTPLLPLALLAGGPALESAVRKILGATRGRPHVFNLGHGITPDVPVEAVAALVAAVRGS